MRWVPFPHHGMGSRYLHSRPADRVRALNPSKRSPPRASARAAPRAAAPYGRRTDALGGMRARVRLAAACTARLKVTCAATRADVVRREAARSRPCTRFETKTKKRRRPRRRPRTRRSGARHDVARDGPRPLLARFESHARRGGDDGDGMHELPVQVGLGAHRAHPREHAQPVHEAAGGLEVLHVRPGRVLRAPEQNERDDREGPAEIAPRPVVDEAHGAGVPHLAHHRDQQRHGHARDVCRVHALDDVQAVRLGVLDAKRARGGGAFIGAHDSPSDNRTTGELF